MKKIKVNLPQNDLVFRKLMQELMHQITYLTYSIDIKKDLTTTNRQNLETEIELLKEYEQTLTDINNQLTNKE